jgi:transcriptional regulator with GAF, ATPase, and Fis domain
MDASTRSEIDRLRLERDLFLRLLELGQHEDVTPFLAAALDLVVEVTRAERGYLELHGELRMARGFSDDEIAQIKREISSGIVAEAIATGRTISTASALDDPRFRDQKSVQAQKIRAVLCAPIGAPNPMGVLYLQGRSAPGPFPEEDRAHAEVFARHLAPLADRLVVKASREGTDATKELRARLPATAIAAIAGTSPALANVFRAVLVAAPVQVPVLVTGETGTGKTAIARALHEASPRARGPFVEVNCAAVPEALFESELFGAEKGAHSTATRRIEGKIDAAKGGTLFLDEIGEMPLAVQAKLLMFLQSKRYYRLGSTAAIDADVRVVAATNADLEGAVTAKKFREDLFYRLNVLAVVVPPLRERPTDVAPIADAILRSLGATQGKALPLSFASRVALEDAEWPGNVRQLENTLQRGWAIALSEEAIAIEPAHLFPGRAAPDEVEAKGQGVLAYQDATRAFQARYLRDALEATSWNVSETARRIGLARSHLNDLMRAHGLSRTPRPRA